MALSKTTDDYPEGFSSYPSSDSEKKHFPALDNGDSYHQGGSDVALREHSSINERKLMAKIDFRILPCTVIIFFLAFLDKVNIANAATLGMLDDLNMNGATQYNTALVIFFIPYTICEIPGNLLLKKFKPHKYLSICMFIFGTIAMCQGFVQNYGSLLAVRFLLGLTETSVFPGCFYILSMWYKRFEAQRRFSFFFSSASLSGAFGGLLAAAIAKMDGVSGYADWRWIFILEGLLTAVVGIIFYWVIPDFPEEASFLNESEREFIKAKLIADQGKSLVHRDVQFRDFLDVFRDIKVWIAGILYFGLIVPAYGYAYFAPTIIKGYNYSPIETQLFSVPPWASAFVFALIIAFLSDYFRHRYIFAIIPILVAITGFIMLLTIHTHLHAQYAALFLVVMGIYSAMPIVICWFQMNMAGHHRRSIAVAWQIGFGNLGGIPAVYAFLKKDAPRYKIGFGLGVAFLSLSAILCTWYLVCCIRDNKKKARLRQAAGGSLDEDDEGDLSPNYTYLY